MPDTDAARRRLAAAQAALLGALVAGGPAPAGFDPARLEVQRRALVAKRAAVIAGIAPELPRILGERYRPAFAAYARGRPMTGGYRPDAMRFVTHLLESDSALTRQQRRRLRRWYRERSGRAPRGWGPAGLLSRLLRRTRPGA
ncbi:hypothetical protein SAMN05192584_110118 [Streptomyces pini]|uniref:SCO6045-like C-terminal domain-containing protein n=1 Tax=Streptomyces pini TaxID=1520580 RepID=A0A1I4DJ10_9ACTN|nr:hypothetical protein SAMN05192584_110118 [Streptomyces pini]